MKQSLVEKMTYKLVDLIDSKDRHLGLTPLATI